MTSTIRVLAFAFSSSLLAAACSSSKSPASVSLGTCALASACLVTDTLGFGQTCETLDAVALSGSRSTDVAVLRTELDCWSKATTCAAFQACTAPASSDALLCAVPGVAGACSDGVSVTCNEPAEAIDCAAAGLVCGLTTTGTNCGVAKCDPTTFKATCNGDLLVECNPMGAVTQATDCSQFQTGNCVGSSGGASTCTSQVANTCGVVAGVAQCVGNGAACDVATFKNSCKGSVLETCTGGKVATLDCAGEGIPYTCGDDTSGGAACVTTAKQCTETTNESCNDGVVTFCYFGKTTTVDCKSFGLSGCTTTSGNGRAFASCRP